MNGFIAKTAAGLVACASVAALVGCHGYRECVDPCWPERYNAVDRDIVRQTFNAQAGNGHVLDQTVWHHHFEDDPKTKKATKLNAAGVEHLRYLAQRKPGPDSKVYVKYAGDLTAARIQAVQQHLTDYAASQNMAVAFQVDSHDLADPSIHSVPIAGSRRDPITGAQQKLWNSYQGTLPDISAGSGGAGGGTAGASAGGAR